MSTQPADSPAIADLFTRFQATAGQAKFAIDGIQPLAVVTPTSEEEAAGAVAYAASEGLSVIPLGGRTHCHIGNQPSRFDVALDMTYLADVVEFEPADLTITCQAGLTLGELRKRTAEASMRVPFDESIPETATVGGVLAANVSGPERLALGSPRDFTIGMRVVAADGRITRAGGKVVKNVAGYDLCKLYTGSLGTLGVITAATFKVIPLPEATASLSLAFPSAADGCAAARSAHARGLGLASIRLENAAPGWLMAARFAGSPSAVRRSVQETLGIATEMRGTETAHPLADTEVALTAIKLSAPPTRLPSLVERIAMDLPETRIEAWPTPGICRVEAAQLSSGQMQGLLQMAREAGGHGVVERCPAELKTFDVFGYPPDGIDLMRSVKHRFDPTNTLSPGRFAGFI